jgi:hypothetical protein
LKKGETSGKDFGASGVKTMMRGVGVGERAVQLKPRALARKPEDVCWPVRTDVVGCSEIVERMMSTTTRRARHLNSRLSRLPPRDFVDLLTRAQHIRQLRSSEELLALPTI